MSRGSSISPVTSPDRPSCAACWRQGSIFLAGSRRVQVRNDNRVRALLLGGESCIFLGLFTRTVTNAMTHWLKTALAVPRVLAALDRAGRGAVAGVSDAERAEERRRHARFERHHAAHSRRPSGFHRSFGRSTRTRSRRRRPGNRARRARSRRRRRSARAARHAAAARSRTRRRARRSSTSARTSRAAHRFGPGRERCARNAWPTIKRTIPTRTVCRWATCSCTAIRSRARSCRRRD